MPCICGLASSVRLDRKDKSVRRRQAGETCYSIANQTGLEGFPLIFMAFWVVGSYRMVTLSPY